MSDTHRFEALLILPSNRLLPRYSSKHGNSPGRYDDPAVKGR